MRETQKKTREMYERKVPWNFAIKYAGKVARK